MKQSQGNITTLEAVGGLEACANLLLDNPYTTAVNYEPERWVFCWVYFQKVTDKSPDSYESETTIKLYGSGPVKHRLSAIRGVLLELNAERNLASIAIDPVKGQAEFAPRY